MDTSEKTSLTPEPTHHVMSSENKPGDEVEDDVQPDTICKPKEIMDDSNEQDDLQKQNPDGNKVSLHEVPAVFSSTDILRIKNKFLEKVEELRILRVSGVDNEQRINGLVAENHKLERKMDDVMSAKDNQEEQHERDIAEVRKQMEQKMHKLEAEKNQTILKTDMWEKEVKALKEEVRTLLVTKYSLEKTIKDQEHRLQMQSSAGDSHMSQMNALEGRCKDLAGDYNNFREQLVRLENEVKCATDINSKLSRVNKHQTCIITSLTEENQTKQSEIIAIKAHSGQQDGGAVLMHKNAVIQRLKGDLQNKIQINKKLQDQIVQIKEGHQRALSSLSESHLLADRHLNSSLKSAEKVNNLTSDLKETKETLEQTLEQLSSCKKELDRLKEDKENMETDMKAKVEETSVKIQQLQKEFGDVNQAYHNLEELNSSWAKKNKELNASVQKLMHESEEATKQSDEYKTQIEDATKQIDDYKNQIEKTTKEIDDYKNQKEEATKQMDNYKNKIKNLTQRPDMCDISTATEVDIKLDMKNTYTQTSNSDKVDAATGLANEGNVRSKEMKEKIEGEKCTSIHNQEPYTDNSSKNSDVITEVYVADADENVKPCEQEMLTEEDMDTPSQAGVLLPPLLDRCLNKMPTDQVSDFKSGDMESKLRDEQKCRDLTVKRMLSAEADANQPPAEHAERAKMALSLSNLLKSGNTSADTALNAKTVPQRMLPQEVSRKTRVSFNEEYIISSMTSGQSLKTSEQFLEDSETSLTDHPATITMMKSTPTVVTNQAGQMFIRNKIIQTPIVLAQEQTRITEAKPEDPVLTRFKGLAHLTSPPLLSPPVIKRNDQRSPSPGGRYSFQMSSMTSTTRSAKKLTNPDAMNIQPSTPKVAENMLKITNKSQHAKSFHVGGMVSRSSNQGFPESPKQARVLPEFSYSSLNLTFPTPSESAATPSSSGRWFTKMGSGHESGRAQESGRKQPGSGQESGRMQPGNNNNSEEWPDFEGEFSAESQLPVTDNAAPTDQSLPRLVMKRRIQEETLFSDEDDEDNSDPKAGVLSQIERIQTFLKTDRLKRAKKQNKEPVV